MFDFIEAKFSKKNKSTFFRQAFKNQLKNKFECILCKFSMKS